MDFEFEDITWYWAAGYAGDALIIIVLLFIVLTIVGLISGDKHE